MKRKLLTALLVVIVLVTAGYLRLNNINWDTGNHIHPDERFLTMVVNDIKWPHSLAEYFDSSVNPLSPYNARYTFFAYGTLPLYIVKLAADIFGMDNYGQIQLVGRVASALFDIGTVFLVFLIGRKLFRSRVGLLAACFAALSVALIQSAHFFTVDATSLFFATLTSFIAICLAKGGSRWNFLWLGLAFGASLGCKINTVTLVPFILGCIVLRFISNKKRRLSIKKIALYLLLTIGSFVLALLIFRIVQPHTFGGNSFFTTTISENWIKNMQEVQNGTAKFTEFPPAYQWLDRTALWFPLVNMLLWGFGLPLGIACWLGTVFGLFNFVKNKKWLALGAVVWVIGLFTYQGIQFVKPLRYFVLIYPLLFVFGAFLLNWLMTVKFSNTHKNAKPIALNYFGICLTAIVIVSTAFWAFAFTSIYTRPLTRIEASKWIYTHVPEGTTVANEAWDDGLPLNVEGYNAGAYYKGESLGIYDPDVAAKWDKFSEQLGRSEYIFISSNRGYGSLPRSGRRPQTKAYYEKLFAGQLGFDKVAEFTSRPKLFGIEVNDDNAEETFTVYDHPKVTIFKKNSSFTPELIKSLANY